MHKQCKTESLVNASSVDKSKRTTLETIGKGVLLGTSIIKAPYVFARQKHLGTDGAVLSDKTLRNVATTPTQFCITEARFSSHGREDCTANGYAAANFRPVITDEPGTTLNLTDVDFVSNSVTGLRR